MVEVTEVAQMEIKSKWFMFTGKYRQVVRVALVCASRMHDADLCDYE